MYEWGSLEGMCVILSAVVNSGRRMRDIHNRLKINPRLSRLSALGPA